MITVYLKEKTPSPRRVNQKNLELVQKAVWVDLFDVTEDEEQEIERLVGIDIPTKQEMESIEPSMRLYSHNGTTFLTASIIAESTTSHPHQEPVTFIVTSHQIITVRFFKSIAFEQFKDEFSNLPLNPTALLIGLIAEIIKRLADTLEAIGKALEEETQKVFGQNYTNSKAKKVNYQHVVRRLGLDSSLNNKVHGCLMTFHRLLSFILSQNNQLTHEQKHGIIGITKDIDALNDYVTFLSNEITFLLDATLGMISIEQSVIIKIFSVAAVIFLPPTLIASIYGMNFKHMPELFWTWGYLFAIGLMILSAIIPYKFFKYKRWL